MLSPVRFRFLVPDDRGGPVRPWSRYGPHRDALPCELRRRVASCMAHSGDVPSMAGAAAAGSVLATVAFLIAFVTIAWRWEVLMLPLLVLYTGCVVGIVVAIVRIRDRQFAPFLVHTLLAAGHCGSCGYMLRGLRAAGDGCIVCPECRAAWKGVLHDPPPGDDPPWRPTWPARMVDVLCDGRFTGAWSYAALDDRRRAVELVYPNLRRRTPAQWKRVHPATAAAIDKELRGLGELQRLGWATGGLLFAGFGTVWASSLPVSWTLRAALATLYLVPVCLYSYYATQPQTRNRRDIIALLLRRGHCPSCAGSLQGLEPEEDGRVLCRFCAAAWEPVPILRGPTDAGASSAATPQAQAQATTRTPAPDHKVAIRR